MANKRLIDANALLRETDDRLEALAVSQKDEWREGQYDECFNAMIRIKLAPTVDAVEVVHGEWRVTDTIPTIEKQVMCSSCRCIWYYPKARWSDIHLTNYCPNCGAKMDGDGNG